MIEKKKLRIFDYIQHIIEAIDRIETYVAGLDRVHFAENSLVHDAVIRNFEIIGEAANNINTTDRDFTKHHPDLPLDEVYQMRNALSHGYYTVNFTVVWNTIQSDLPALKKQMLALRDSSVLGQISSDHAKTP